MEVLEHLFGDIQVKGLFETVRVLKKDGSLFISVPYKEPINYISCTHCKSLTVVDSYHRLCRDKKDIILSEIQACEVLLRYPRVENDTITVEKRF